MKKTLTFLAFSWFAYSPIVISANLPQATVTQTAEKVLLGPDSVHQPKFTIQLVKESFFLDKDDVVEAKLLHGDEHFGAIEITLTPVAAGRLTKLTAENIGLRAMMTIGDQIISSPVVHSELGTTFGISCDSKETAEKIIKALIK